MRVWNSTLFGMAVWVTKRVLFTLIHAFPEKLTVVLWHRNTEIIFCTPYEKQLLPLFFAAGIIFIPRSKLER